jgi:hypothetical protein
MISVSKAKHLIGELLALLVVLGSTCSADRTLFPSAGTATADDLATKREGGSVRELTPSGMSVTLPPQGLYESCLPMEASCLDRLTEMGTNGFTIVLNDGLRYASSADALRAYADRAYELGMKVILPVKYSPEWDGDDAYLVTKFADLAQECGCTDNEGFLTYYVNALRDHPALWGYYMADEVHPEYHSGLQVYADLVKSLDPHHPRLIVEEGTNEPMEIYSTFHSYMKDTTDVLAADYYPYGYIDTFGSVTRFTGASARTTQHWSEKLHLQSAMVLQAFAQPQYYGLTNPLCLPWPFCAPFPSYEQMKAQRDQTIQNARPEIILWFSYPDILDSDDPARHWQDLVAAAFAPLPDPIPAAAPRPQDCPEGWNCEDIGQPKLQGTQSLAGGVWSVEGSGWDIWSSMWEQADQFRMIWQEWAANGELTARVLSQTDTNSRAKAGIMVRETFDPVAPYYAVFVTPQGGIRVQCRYDFNQDPVSLASVRMMVPVYLRITRTGTTYSAYVSADGADWALIHNSAADMANLSGPLMAGLAVTSRDEDRLSTAEFDRVSMTGSNQ